MIDEFSNEAGVSMDEVSPYDGQQCPICLKRFVSSKGLVQHSIIHTDRKPYACEVCGKPFRFKSNLFEHRSIHSGEKPFACPFCGKECRLKGNLKKHLKTHVKEEEEIDRAYETATGSSSLRAVMCLKNEEYGDEVSGADSSYSPYLSNGRQRRRIVNSRKITKAPSVALVVTVGQDDQEPEELYAEAPSLYLSLGEMLGKEYSMAEFCKAARSIPFEMYRCRLCHVSLKSRFEMKEHCEVVHNMSKHSINGEDTDEVVWCDVCLAPFDDRQSFDRHWSFHTRVRNMIACQEITLGEPGASSF
ncbi:unnamed protein product [Soboliphyme baturini]|uniref:Zinc finger protein n=1 Tax=Soboliphyme baturini TaxID=241478 RepID=A0A183IR79_9BILA|nr:unnamed protein product [Soboliphyme baturini]